MNLEGRILNVRPDPIDPRDHDFAATPHAILRAELPHSVDFTGRVGPIVDQGETGSCVGQACAALCYWLWHKTFSARWIWMGAKEIDAWTPSCFSELAGTGIRDAFKVLRKYGACTDDLWPLSQQLPRSDREQVILDDAEAHRIGRWWRLKDAEARKRHLAQHGPCVIAVPVYENWSDIGEDGIVPHPYGAELGGHAILEVGYIPGFEIAKNSWGMESGRNGYLWLPDGYPIWDALGTAAPEV